MTQLDNRRVARGCDQTSINSDNVSEPVQPLATKAGSTHSWMDVSGVRERSKKEAVIQL